MSKVKAGTLTNPSLKDKLESDRSKITFCPIIREIRGFICLNSPEEDVLICIVLFSTNES
jgi:hypothetical protein